MHKFCFKDWNLDQMSEIKCYHVVLHMTIFNQLVCFI